MVAVNYLWNPINDNIVREFDDAGNTFAEYTAEPELYGNLVSQYRSGQTNYLHFDAQGNTTELTNDVGSVTDTIRYSAFGEVAERTGSTAIPFQYIGRKGYYRDDDIGEHLVRERRISPVLGRWRSRDPLEAIAPMLHAYIYARNSPVTYYDPSGFQEDACGAVDKECCCCADSLTVDNLKPYTKRNPRQIGCTFLAAIKLSFKKWTIEPKSKECTLEWWEWMTIVETSRRVLVRDTPKSWINRNVQQPGQTVITPTLDPWNKPRNVDCPTKKPIPVDIRDEPALGLGLIDPADPIPFGVQHLFIAIKVTSAKDCDACDPVNGSFVKYLHIHIETERRTRRVGGQVREEVVAKGSPKCDLIKQLPPKDPQDPNAPGNPPVGDWPVVEVPK